MLEKSGSIKACFFLGEIFFTLLIYENVELSLGLISIAEFFPETAYGFLITVTAKNGRTRYEYVHTCGGSICDRSFVNAAINLYECAQIFVLDHLAQRFDFLQAVGNEGLATKSGVNTHNKHIIDILNYPFQGLDRS